MVPLLCRATLMRSRASPSLLMLRWWPQAPATAAFESGNLIQVRTTKRSLCNVSQQPSFCLQYKTGALPVNLQMIGQRSNHLLISMLLRACSCAGTIDGFFMADTGLSCCSFAGAQSPDTVVAGSESGVVHFLELPA